MVSILEENPATDLEPIIVLTAIILWFPHIFSPAPTEDNVNPQKAQLLAIIQSYLEVRKAHQVQKEPDVLEQQVLKQIQRLGQGKRCKRRRLYRAVMDCIKPRLARLKEEQERAERDSEASRFHEQLDCSAHTAAEPEETRTVKRMKRRLRTLPENELRETIQNQSPSSVERRIAKRQPTKRWLRYIPESSSFEVMSNEVVDGCEREEEVQRQKGTTGKRVCRRDVPVESIELCE